MTSESATNWLRRELSAFSKINYLAAHGTHFTKVMAAADPEYLRRNAKLALRRLTDPDGTLGFDEEQVKLDDESIDVATSKIEAAMVSLLVIRLDSILGSSMDLSEGIAPGQSQGKLKGRLAWILNQDGIDKTRRLCCAAWILKQKRNDLVHNHGIPSEGNYKALLNFGIADEVVTRSYFGRDLKWSDIRTAKQAVTGVANKFIQLRR